MLLEPQFTARAADELFSRDRFEIKPFTMMCSPMAEGLSETARGEFHSSYGPSLLFLESIWRAMSGHILRNHAATGPARLIQGAFFGGPDAPARRMHSQSVAAIGRVIEAGTHAARRSSPRLKRKYSPASSRPVTSEPEWERFSRAGRQTTGS